MKLGYGRFCLGKSYDISDQDDLTTRIEVGGQKKAEAVPHTPHLTL